MARLTKPLTDTEIKAAKPQEADYTLHDGDGLATANQKQRQESLADALLPAFNQKARKTDFWALSRSHSGRCPATPYSGHRRT